MILRGRRLSVAVALGALTLTSSCWLSAPEANKESNESDEAVRRTLHIDDSTDYWAREGFVEMVPPIRLPTNLDRSDIITVWLKIPAGGKLRLRRSNDPASLLYPPSTVADRVELIGSRVVDVRGTKFESDGKELFHVYRGYKSRDKRKKAPLKGFEWRRGDVEAQQWADGRLEQFLLTTIMPGMTRPLNQVARARLKNFNQCARCHIYDKPTTLRPSSAKVKLPRRPTDGHGLYAILSVLSDSAPLAVHRPIDLNVDDPYVSVSCGDEPARLIENKEVRHFVCDNGLVPVGRRDIVRGLQEKDEYTIRVCQSRRYLYEHFDEALRQVYAAIFAQCGVLVGRAS